MDYDDGAGSAKRLKSSTGAPISASPSTSLPQYQPPNGARVSSTASLSRSRANGAPSLNLTVKAAPSKLRQATSGQTDPYEDEQVSDATPASRSVRSTRNPRAVVEPDSDDDVEDSEMIQTGFDEDDEDEDEEMDDEDEDEDAEGEEDEEDMIQRHPPPPRIQQTYTAQGKPKVKVSVPNEGALKSVEDKEMDDDDDDDLSDAESMDPLQDDTVIGHDDEDDDLDEDDIEDDDDGSGDGSRSATPDLTKLTRRQRGQFEEFDGGLMALSNEAQKKKHISAEEHVMRRAEMARRRKNLSEKRNEEEKIDTINKLLKKPAPKRRTRAEMLAAQAANASTPGADGEEDEYRADPVFVRWESTQAGSRIGVPIEWLQSPVGEMLAKPEQRQSSARIMIEEVA